MVNRDYTDKIHEIYIVYYGRPADPLGLEYWSARLDAENGDLSQVIDAFGASEEYSYRYADLDSVDLIANIYQQAFGREPDDVGLAFYLERLESGVATLANVALQILDGANAEDFSVVANKVEFSGFFLEDVLEAGRLYAGSGAGTEASLFLTGVSAESNSVIEQRVQARDVIQRFISDPAIVIESGAENTESGAYNTRVELDYDLDGLIDELFLFGFDRSGQETLFVWGETGVGQNQYVRTTEINEQGLVTARTWDYDGDHVIDSYILNDYNELGYTTRLESRGSGNRGGSAPDMQIKDGSIETWREIAECWECGTEIDMDAIRVTYYEYDDHGERVKIVKEVDGSIVGTQEWHREYDDDGNIKLYRETNDWDADDIVDSITSQVYVYDAQGNLTYSLNERDWNGDGVIDDINVYTKEYNDEGILVNSGSESIKSLDGVIISTSVDFYEINDQGKYTRREERDDVDGDGVIDRIVIETIDYDELGNRVRGQSDDDFAADGEIDRSTKYEASFDEYGNVIREQVELTDGDSYQYRLTVRSYDYNEVGDITRRDEFRGVEEDGSYAEAKIYEYDDQGEEKLFEWDRDGDGDIDVREVHQFDDQGNVISYSRETNRRNESDYASFSYYDDQGLIKYTQIDEGADGVIDGEWTYGYDTQGSVALIGISGVDLFQN